MKKFVAFIVLLAASAVGQENYTVTSGSYISGNDNNCTTHNCFLPVAQYQGGSQAQFQAISSGQDMTVLGIDLNHGVWQLPVATSGRTIWQPWAPAASMYLYGLAVRTSSEVYALEQTAACGGGNYQPFVWNGSTWSGLGGCLVSIAITPDGILLGINSADQSFMATNPLQSNWAQLAGSGWTAISGLSYATAYAISGGSLYTVNLTNNTYSQLATPSSVQSVAVASEQWLSIVTTSGAVYMMDLTAQTPTWLPMQGSLSRIYGSFHHGIFGTDGNSYPYHYLSLAATSWVTTSGNYQCPIGGCPRGSYHTRTSTVQYPTGYFSGVASYGSAPANNGSATATDMSGACDMVYGDPTSPECKPKISKGEVTCVVMGLLLSRLLTLDLPQYGFRDGSGYATQVSVNPNPVTGTYTYCLADNCSPKGIMNIGAPNQNCGTNPYGGGGNATDRLIDPVKTDTSFKLRTFCVWGYGWLTQCFVPGGTWAGADIVSKNVSIPYGGCDTQ